MPGESTASGSSREPAICLVFETRGRGGNDSRGSRAERPTEDFRLAGRARATEQRFLTPSTSFPSTHRAKRRPVNSADVSQRFARHPRFALVEIPNLKCRPIRFLDNAPLRQFEKLGYSFRTAKISKCRIPAFTKSSQRIPGPQRSPPKRALFRDIDCGPAPTFADTQLVDLAHCEQRRTPTINFSVSGAIADVHFPNDRFRLVELRRA